MGKKSLVALDTDHIKSYVFATDKLKEIRGASSILDRLNRNEMKNLAYSVDPNMRKVYANGGSGLFLVDAQVAEEFGRKVQQAYREATDGGATITFAVQELPDDPEKDLWSDPIPEELELLRYKLREAKDRPIDLNEERNPDKNQLTDPEYVRIALPSHPLMHLCDACGVRYAESTETSEEQDPEDQDLADQDKLYCNVCFTKRQEDLAIKIPIARMIGERIDQGEIRHKDANPFLWEHLIGLLPRKYLEPDTKRPRDFNVFRQFSGAKEYLGLIYADGNGMGKEIETWETLSDIKNFAENVDNAIYKAVSIAIAQHLPIDKELHLFPFDILLVGGDDIVIVTSASKALDMALTIGEQFHRLTKEKDSEKKGHTLSVGVVLAPIKYPFGLLQDLAESTLKFAKKAGTDARAKSQTEIDDTRINFLVVTGGSGNDFKKVYNRDYHLKNKDKSTEFFTTLRPYDPEQLGILLNSIREGHRLGLGRTKLHQVREAILKKNLATSVMDGLAVLRNWKLKQRLYMVQQVYKFGGRYQAQHFDEDDPGSLFPQVTFPWFADGETKHGSNIYSVYRASLLDFVELYDFVAREEVENGDEV